MYLWTRNIWISSDLLCKMFICTHPRDVWLTTE
jgi:hypothetical protein